MQGRIGWLLGMLIASGSQISCSQNNGLACIAVDDADAGTGKPLGSICPEIGPGNKVQCYCKCGILDLDGTTVSTVLGSGQIDVCVPPDLVAAARTNPGGPEAYQINAYCGNVVGPAIRDVGRLYLGSGYCGIGAGCTCTEKIQPNGVATIQNDICDQECPDVTCVKGKCNDDKTSCTGNCFNPFPNGIGSDLHIENCMCSRATDPCSDDPAPLTSDKICVAYPGSGDPPGIFAGIDLEILAGRSEIEIDHDSSLLQMNAAFDDDLGIHHTDSRTAHVNGMFRVYGYPATDGSASLVIDFGLFPDDFTFHFFPPTDIAVTQMAITGGTGVTPIHFGSDGLAILPAGSISLSVDYVQDGKRFRAVAVPPKPVLLRLDFAGGTFEVPSIGLALQGITGNISLVGGITNRPPFAVAGPNQVVECTSPSGAMVTLSGAVTDPDNDISKITWTNDADVVAETTIATVEAPIGQTTYTIAGLDSHLMLSRANTNVTVQDTTAPSLAVVALPSCLWSPNHQMVLYELGKGMSATATDACDASPQLKIVDIVSDQPPQKDGSGNTPVDVVFGSGAFCVDAERSAKIGPRHYTVTVEATDARGNSARQQVVISVPHDQGASSCALIDPNLLVDAGDPRCVADAPSPSATAPATVPVPPPTHEAPRRAQKSSGRGCSYAPSGTPPAGAVLLIVALLALVFRARTRWVAIGLCLIAASAGCNSSSSKMNMPLDAGPLPSCVLGWFVDPTADACGLCGASKTPECGASDCKQLSFYGYLSGGIHYEAIVSYSQKTATMSTVTPAYKDTYMATETTITLRNQQLSATCNATQLSFSGYSENRASTGFADALNQATASGGTSWTAVPVK
jgi:hypothetical protein